MIKLLIFDLDGVLVDSRDMHYHALNRALAKVDQKYVITREEHLSTFDGLPTTKKLKMLSELKELPETEYEKIWKLKQEETINIIDKELTYDERIRSILKQLKLDGYKIHVASNSIRNSTKMFLLRKGYIEYIDYFISNEDVNRPKPYPEMYMKCMLIAGVVPHEVIIIEDSHIGRKAAIDSGGHLHAIENVESLTYGGIMDSIEKANENVKNGISRPKWIGSNTNVLIPMAGAGSRFSKAGYTFPKPLIEVNGKPMIQLVVENLNIDANYIFIVQQEHYDKYNLKYLLRLIAPNCTVIPIDGVTEGAACTTLLAKEFIDNDDHLLIANSDQFIDWDSNEFMYSMVADEIDGGILTFKSTHPKWSFAKLNENGFVSEIAEKKPISDNATCLHYDTPILLANGSTQVIGKIVNQQLDLSVMSYNHLTEKLEPKQITGFVKKLDENVEWYKLSYALARKSKAGYRRIHITGDHRVVTNNGEKRVDELSIDDKILTRYKIPNKTQMNFINGTMLGDAYYVKPNKFGELGRLSIKQSGKQKEWFNVKKLILEQFGGSLYSEPECITTILGRTCNSSGSHKYSASANPIWSKERERWYPNGKKEVPEDIILSPIGLASWYMDDGSLSASKERIVLCTDSFSEKSISILRKKLLNIGINTKIWTRNKKQYRIVISNHGKELDAFNFFDIIKEYIIPSMQYKLPDFFKGNFNPNRWDLGNAKLLYSNVVVEKINEYDMASKHPHLYCLEVEDNHNFVAGDMVVNNCGIYYWTQGSDYVKYAEDMISSNKRVNGEFYTCPVYNEAIEDNKKIKIFPIKKMWGLGTPEDLDIFIREGKGGN